MRCHGASLSNNSTRRFVSIALVSASLLVLSGCSGSDNDDDDSSVMQDGSGELPTDADTDNEIDPDFADVDPSNNIPDPNAESILERLNGDTDYSQFLTAIVNADLAEALQNDNSGMGWTLFAPSDTAFANANFASVTDEQNSFLVRSHLHSGIVKFDDLPGMLEMVDGVVVIEENADGSKTVGGALIVAPDREFSNGVIHFVNAVVEPLVDPFE